MTTRRLAAILAADVVWLVLSVNPTAGLAGQLSEKGRALFP